MASEPYSTDSFGAKDENDFRRATDDPLSTFSIDVDTASYSIVRRMIREGQRPPVGAVRIEELVNYFTYGYPEPSDGRPFSVTTEVAAAPWAPAHRLVRIGLKAKSIEARERAPDNLVFLIDVSGSMMTPDKLPLLVQSMKLLVDQLERKDRVSIVVYAGNTGLVLPPTSGDRRREIREALDRLSAGGSTNGGAGIELAYATARKSFISGGNNRVILCTDGDFNVGVSNQSELVERIEQHAKEGIFLSVLGFGLGNLKDDTMEKLADRGNGNYAYIDSLAEARKVLVQQAGGTLVTVAKDVKIQVEWNPAQVGAYRLIGYENRMLAAQDFNDDKKDAGEIGAGHSVTALYEVVPQGAPEAAVHLHQEELIRLRIPAIFHHGYALPFRLMT
jgi:Ca-activated chloride channel family protein